MGAKFKLPSKKAVVLIVGLLTLFGVLAGCSQVKTGNITRCKHCNKEIENTVQSITVPFWDAKNYQVTSSSTYCESCGTEKIPYKIHHICKKCQREFNTEDLSAMRRDEKSDQTLQDKYCDTCGKEVVPFTFTIVCPSCGKSREETGSDYREREDIHRNQRVEMVCEYCRKRAKTEEIAGKVGDVLGGIGGAIGKGMQEGMNRHR